MFEVFQLGRLGPRFFFSIILIIARVILKRFFACVTLAALHFFICFLFCNYSHPS